ncbi:peptide-methionine (R)-S-oxide reductase KNAG_0C00470 [Huiozyma naganishii CBS 8797]|uniref:Peptide-methionine (R)-S-oxide reductase n=1 Tax=Huiozyma naganishii (strain ATCC MYA-139 / BCRC 22969 / CBS 8797 / KCTC 17520 / NBRC 10181 / NCYC 3082 / Yp74L-3) TaxID=1071383 RepID=J7S5I0_HUIN7|nr:hypothetical protein KNAG_0C00470 [Kazachstania naganishii CBS 8797]CCK69161.1 hypothetical protein KNAG_0C00470 [Kazachstania naganishii CBS 8797]
MPGSWNKQLSAAQLRILRDKMTEPAHSGRYLNNKEQGTYYCANCLQPIYQSKTKFDSGCGWPSFYEELPNSLKYVTDSSGGMVRTEIVCSNCGGHMGHIFQGEGWKQALGLPKDVRHCVNSLSLNFKKD